MGTIRGALRRVAIAVPLAVAFALLLGWLIGELPALAGVFSLLGLALMARVLFHALRSPSPIKALAILGGGIGAALLFTLLLDSVVDERTPATAATESEEPITGSGEPAADEDAPLSEEQDPESAVEPPAEPSQEPPAEPPPAPPPELPSLVLAVTDPDDCACAASEELQGLGVAVSDASTVIDIALRGESDAELWLWDSTQPAEPIRLTTDGSVWTTVAGPDGVAIAVARDGISVTVPRSVEGAAWAVVSAAGDRVPDRGAVAADGIIVTLGDRGAIAAALEAQLEELQRGLPTLEDGPASFVLSLIGRQVKDGTSVIRLTLLDQPEAAPVELNVTVEWPRFTQHVTLPAQQSGVWVTVDAILSCTGPDGAVVCNPVTLVLPLDVATAVVADPGALLLELFPGEDFDGARTLCARVRATPVGSTGTSCWLDDGRLSFAERAESQDRLELITVSEEIDPDRLPPPE